jgi:hypothetical protein
MMMSSQIVALACQIAKTPGFTSQAGQFLNARLVKIALDQDLDIIRRTTTINVLTGTPSYNLPANYLRAREVFYSIQGVKYTLTPRSLQDYDALYNAPGFQDWPYIYATDIAQSPPLLYLYPTPSIALTLTVRYMDTNVEITTPETSSVIPWFQDQALLVDMVAEDLMKIADDARQPQFFQKNDEDFRRMLRMANDKEDRALTVKLDPARFRAARSVKPTKLQGD